MATTGWGRAAEFESNVARDEEVSDSDIHFSRLTGIAPADIDRLKDFSYAEGLLVVIRCPKRPARYHHGKVQPKGITIKAKSDDDTGLASVNGRAYVSDYDLMCIYRSFGPDGYEKIDISGVDPTRPRSRLSPEATALLRKANAVLKSRFQHGGQDDYASPKNPGVSVGTPEKRPDRFAAFEMGEIKYFPNPALMKRFYEKHALDWPYGPDGIHRAAG